MIYAFSRFSDSVGARFTTRKRDLKKEKGGDFMKNGFTAKKAIFCGEHGYYVSQYIDGKEVAKQFIPENHFREFCEAAGINPVIID